MTSKYQFNFDPISQQELEEYSSEHFSSSENESKSVDSADRQIAQENPQTLKQMKTFKEAVFKKKTMRVREMKEICDEEQINNQEDGGKQAVQIPDDIQNDGYNFALQMY